MSRTILIVAAHPDDEILGCGGTIARLIREGYEAYTLILGEGITSRYDKQDRIKRERELNNLKIHIDKANRIIGVKNVFIERFPDNRFDTVSLLDIVKAIENIKNKIKPDVVFTHYEDDLNIDHQITHRAVLTASRPLHDEPIKEIYSFEILSSTEWSYPLNFSPNVFYDISDTLDLKLQAIAEYKWELRNYPHPRSLEGINNNAKLWGIKCGLKYAEAFKVVRIIR